mmetsp:Transcript_4644/g.10808  ORF Transcript_4644/g.10808 Transcript_4644/m.10808 type:complete len:156 (-) Transcript_4644:17-484(-)|eukprot:7245580-Prymnesium_polylepis.1
MAPPSWAENFAEYNTSTWSVNSWLGGWNGEFSFYTGTPSNRSQNVIVEDGILYLQPDLTANFRPNSGDRLGWKKVLGCGRTDPTKTNDCPRPEDTASFALGGDADGPCSAPWDKRGRRCAQGLTRQQSAPRAIARPRGLSTVCLRCPLRRQSKCN